MTEKAALKKEQQQNHQQNHQQNQQNHQKNQQNQQQNQQKKKKVKQPEQKKKNVENKVNPPKEKLPTKQNSVAPKKKNKTNKNQNNNSNNKNISKAGKKKTGEKSFLWILLTRLSYVLLVLGFIYVVDFEKFNRIRNYAGFCISKVIDLLPPQVVTKGREAFEYVRPVADVTVSKASFFVNEMSTFFNTNPIVKDHWANVKEIGSICSARVVDYMRTLYLQTTGYYSDFKSKLFQ